MHKVENVGNPEQIEEVMKRLVEKPETKLALENFKQEEALDVVEDDAPGIETEAKDPLNAFLAEPTEVATPPDAEPPIVEEFTQDAPANTINELSSQVMRAKLAGGQFVECTERVMKHLLNGKYPDTHYIDYQGIRLVAAGKLEEVKTTFKRDCRDGIVIR